MADRMLMHKPSGILYIWQEAFAERDDFEEVFNVEAKEITTEPQFSVKIKKRKIETVDDSLIAAQSSRGLP